MTDRSDTVTVGLAPICAADMHTLVLGSLPSRKSLELGEYYGHPQNAFWRIMGELLGAGRDLPYDDRVARLLGAGIGVWDVLRSSVRPGSMDADIDLASAKANDFDTFLCRYPGVRRICFNGRKAADMFERKQALTDQVRAAGIEFVSLPSTSPAFASMSFDEKLRRWATVIDTPAGVR